MKRKFDKSVVRSDPAPSRISYFFHRAWLRKSFRFSTVIVLPALILVTLIFSISKTYKLDLLVKNNVESLIDVVAFSPVFKVVNLSVISDDSTVVEKIKTNLDLNFPVSSLDINVENLKVQIEKIKLVRSASVRLTSNGLIEVAVEIRKPVAIQRKDKKFLLLDNSGIEVDEVITRSERLDLPLLVGYGSEKKVQEALNLLLETKSLIVRVRGLVRIGDRRWDVILDRNQVIKLPEENPIQAMKKVISLQEGRRVLDRNILYIDVRNINRPVLGLTEESSKELKKIRNLARGENV